MAVNLIKQRRLSKELATLIAQQKRSQHNRTVDGIGAGTRNTVSVNKPLFDSSIKRIMVIFGMDVMADYNE